MADFSGILRLLSKNRVLGIYMPSYLPEITTIYRYVERNLPNHLIGRFAKPKWNSLNPLIKMVVKEGDRICNHIQVLNPPISPFAFSGEFTNVSEDENIERALVNLWELGMRLPENEILEYESPLRGENIQGLDEEYNRRARQFVHQFFISLSNRTLNNIRPQTLNYYVGAHLRMTANQASVVFKYEHPRFNSWLFTGDADEKVFERLITSRKDISAKYLKIPHHGSRENLSRSALNAINPKIAIVSHNNRRFGLSSEAHPHNYIIDLLDELNITTYYTNPVKKGGMIVKKGTTGPQENGLINFV